MFSPGEQFLEPPQPDLQKLHHPLAAKYGIEIDVLRLDKIHPVISGNKFFKLRYFLEEAERLQQGIVTFGGPWSNHLLATAYSCHQRGIPATGLIRGEMPSVLSETLKECDGLGMKLLFLSRDDYRTGKLPQQVAFNNVIVPEGGASTTGIQGASTILDYIDSHLYDELACSIGTGTMMAGLLQQPRMLVRGFSALKISSPGNDLETLLQRETHSSNFIIEYDFHFGGYAKHPPDLIEFMNSFFLQTTIPTDIVYTSKLFFGILTLIESGKIPAGTRICAIHSGGLQGNRSLAPGLLQY